MLHRMVGRRRARARTGPPAGIALALLTCAAVGVVRAPNLDVIGADLLVRTAIDCDIPTGWHLLNSSSFRPGWLVQMGSAGETPLMAATRSPCAELVALIVLHPEFDGKTIQKMRSRKALHDHAARFWDGKEAAVRWALAVVGGVRNGKMMQGELELDPTMARRDLVWFLPKPGEWSPPMTLEAMGFDRPPKPRWNLSGIAYAAESTQRVVIGYDGGASGRVDYIDRLWYLLIAHLTEATGSERQAAAARHIRSMGWSLFFCKGAGALLSHYFIARMSHGKLDLLPDSDPLHDHIRAEGRDVAQAYADMAKTLGNLWNKTGNWIVADNMDVPK